MRCAVRSLLLVLGVGLVARSLPDVARSVLHTAGDPFVATLGLSVMVTFE